MTDLKFEQKRSLSRLEAADQLAALATALREGGDAELEIDPWKLSLRIPDNVHSEIEFEVEDGEIELEIELKWPITSAARTAPSPATEERTATKRTTAKRTTAKRATAKRTTAKRAAAAAKGTAAQKS